MAILPSLQYLFLCLGILVVSSAFGQNLVPNGSFEEYSTCPDNIGQADRAIGWTVLTGSPDYYNSCADTFLVDVPGNAFGYQQASDGQGYIGCFTYETGPVYRENVQAELTTPLVPGQLVYLSMKVSTGGFGVSSDGNYNVRLASRGIGMRFSTIPLDPGLYITNTAALYMNAVLQDTAIWVTLSSIFMPDSAYAYVQIGNFFSDSLSTPFLLDPNGMTDGSYAFIDEVCVSTMSGECDGANGIARLRTSPIQLYVMLRGNQLTITIANAIGEHVGLVLMDLMGRVCWHTELARDVYEYQLSMTPYAQGLYLLSASSSLGVRCSIKFIFPSP